MKIDNKYEQNDTIGRRKFLSGTILAGAGVAIASIPGNSNAKTPRSGSISSTMAKPGRRRLGKLEVSAVGMGVQNMHRKYDTTVPYRPQMIEILRNAYDRGITFFDCAEAYGPWEKERILGEAIQPFRNKVKITTKYGWNVDGRRQAGGFPD